MSSIISQYKKGKGEFNNRIDCEDCLFYNPFGDICEFHLIKDIMDLCGKFEDRRCIIKDTKTLGELPK